MSEKPKYIKVTSLQKANEMSEEYSLREPIVYQHTKDGAPGHIFTDVEYLMSLREDAKYENVEAFKRMPITDDWTLVPDGVQIIHHTSKEMIVTRKGNQPNIALIRELLTHIFNISEDKDTKDPSTMDQIYKLADKALNLIDGVQVATVGE